MTIIWQNPGSQPQLERDRVHIWRANLDLPVTEITKLNSLLSQDELARASKFRFYKHKNSFIASRGILRQLLGHYLAINPQDLQFNYGERGKPQLGKIESAIGLQFNISHSQKYALFGFTYNRLIGVDIEYLREMKDAVKIARRFFGEREYELIANLDISQQAAVFLQLWTAKEAYLKAIGMGLAGSLANIEITLDPVGNANIFAIDGDNFKTKDWSMHSCTPDRGYIAAIAIEKSVSKQQIDFWTWQEYLMV